MLHWPLDKPALRPQAGVRAMLAGLALMLVMSIAGPAAGSPLIITALDRVGSVAVAVDATNKFFRLRSVDVSATASGFTNLVQAYGLLETMAGRGDGLVDGVSYWQNSFEGDAATAAALSRPHYAMADRAGNIYIVDKDSHSIFRVGPNGLIHTQAGTHTGGFNGQGPAPATNLQLSFPSALWVRADGTVYVLDNGAPGTTHSGDDAFFNDPSVLKISEGRSVTLDMAGNMLVCESDYGFVRRIRFQRMAARH